MFSYVAYGLRIRSELPLPELLPGNGGQDVVVRVGKIPGPAGRTGSSPPDSRGGADAVYSYERVGALRVSGGREILVDPLPGVEDCVLRLFILGGGLARILHQRGYLVLHASAVALLDTAVAFLGDAGWGKSTTAAAFLARGHAVVADDLVAVRPDAMEPDGPTIYPGFPHLKLWPEAAAAALGDRPDELLRIRPELEKRGRPIRQGFPTAPLGLRAIYVLAQGPGRRIEGLRSQEAFAELVRHSYCASILSDMERPLHLEQCAALASRVPVRRLEREGSLDALEDLVRLVEEDLKRVTDPQT